jgi:fructose-1,6-bisphosphatase/inositol monophosphatase family enzyme
MVMEAGGAVTDLRGGKYRSDDREVLASNGLLHEEILAVMTRYQPLDAPSDPVQLGA